MANRKFETRLNTWKKNAVNGRDTFQDLLDEALSFYLDSGDSLQVTNAVQAFGEAFGLIARKDLIRYVEARSPSMVYKDLEHGFSFVTKKAKGKGKIDRVVLSTAIIGTWYQWKAANADDIASKPKTYDVGARIRSIAKGLNKALDDVDGTTVRGTDDVRLALEELQSALTRLDRVKAPLLANLK